MIIDPEIPLVDPRLAAHQRCYRGVAESETPELAAAWVAVLERLAIVQAKASFALIE